MAVDINLLRMLKHREDFRRVFGRVPGSAINPETKAILSDYKKYFDKFPDHATVDMTIFVTLFRTWHSTLTDEKRSVYELVLENAKTDVPEGVRQEIMRNVLELRMSTDLANLLLEFEEGNVSNINAEIKRIQTAFKADAGISEITFIQDDIHDLLDADEANEGLKFRLSCLNTSMRPLRDGDFGIVAGRPDKGKTTFISSEITFFAPQLPPDRNVLWLNNEGMGKRIIPRVYQSALGLTRSQLLVLKQANKLKEAYVARMGRLDRIRIVDIHGMDNFSVEQIIEANNAGVVIYDMIDNIRGFGGESRTDQRLEEMYKWGRDCAVNMSHVGIATSQISVEGDNMQFPAMSMLKDSKTGKQGACDFQIMLGSLHDPGYANVRWIGVPKNKLRLDNAPADPRAAVKFDGPRALFVDMPVMDGDINAKTE